MFRQLLTDISDSDISRYVAARQRAGASATTLRNEVGTLRSLLNRHGLWRALKATGVKLPALVETEIGIALSPEQETKLRAACAAGRSRSLLPAVPLALHTGLREGELRTLRWAQSDLARHTLRVGASKAAAGSGRVVLLSGPARRTRPAIEANPGHAPSTSSI